MPKTMSYGRTRRPKAVPDAEVRAERERVLKLREAVGETVLMNIGRPDDLHKVDAKVLWDERHFRVNVYRTVKKKLTMTDSHFLKFTEDFFLVESSPPLVRRYWDDELEKIRPLTAAA